MLQLLQEAREFSLQHQQDLTSIGHLVQSRVEQTILQLISGTVLDILARSHIKESGKDYKIGKLKRRSKIWQIST